MRFYFLIFSILITSLLLTESAISADRSPGTNNMRWGITTNVPVEETEDDKDKGTGEETGVKSNHKDDLKDKKKTGLEEAPEGVNSGEKGDAGGNKPIENKIGKEKQPDTIAPEKTKASAKKVPEETSKKQKDKEALIKWENETQKTHCNAYLASLRESFLKARYYSIQGVPCGTAENARSFMTLVDQCKRECPEEFLKKNGYTSRIIRNLSWLEKLGVERCPELELDLPQTHTDPHGHQEKGGNKAIQQKKS